MASYELVFKKSVTKDLRSLSKEGVQRILRRCTALADEPRPVGCERLSGRERYRVRQGVYRIIYEVLDHRLVVLVVRTGHRGEVYRRR